jgi:hypothetical protein
MLQSQKVGNLQLESVAARNSANSFVSAFSPALICLQRDL